MKILRIFDVMPFVHAGAVNKRAYLQPEIVDTPEGYVSKSIYVGGVSMIWNILYQEYGRCDMVFCSDRQAGIKQDMFPMYKSHREHNPNVTRMRDACEYILKDCGFDVLADTGYEADDFIYSLVKEKKNEYDHIYVYTGDSDLYFLVDEKVTILPSSSRAKTVTLDNYTYTVGGSKMEYVPYNLNTVYKIMYGDTSDGIPPLDRSYIPYIRECFERESLMRLGGDKEMVLSILRMFPEPVWRQGELVFPLDTRVPEYIAQGDKLRIAEWGNAFQNQFWKTGGPTSSRVSACIEEMAELDMCYD